MATTTLDDETLARVGDDARRTTRATKKTARAARTRDDASTMHASKRYNVTILPGDGIGPEIMRVARDALEAAGARADVAFAFEEGLVGGSAIDAHGDAAAGGDAGDVQGERRRAAGRDRGVQVG